MKTFHDFNSGTAGFEYISNGNAVVKGCKYFCATLFASVVIFRSAYNGRWVS